MGPFPRSVTNLTIFKFRGLTEPGVVLYFYSPVKGEVDKRTFNCGFSIGCISTCTPTYLYISTEGGGSSVVDTIKGYPTKRVLLGRDSVVMVRGMIWETFSPYSICFLFFYHREHMRTANTHLPSKSAVALHYIRLSEQQYRAASRLGGEEEHIITRSRCKKRKGKANKPWTIALFWNI
jgi:hypothetical protein